MIRRLFYRARRGFRWSWEAFRRPKVVNEKYENWELDGETPRTAFLAATAGAGLLLYSNGRFFKLLAGRKCFGLTRHGDRWYTFLSTRSQCGKIISFRLDADKARDVRTVLWGLSGGVHQIDFVDDELFVMDTYNNRILIYPHETLGRKRHWRSRAKSIYPCGMLDHGRDSSNYAHLNSVFASGGRIHLLAHNETMKSGRSSEEIVLRDDLEIETVQDLGGGNCHNLYVDDKLCVVCRSKEGTLAVNGVDVLSVSGFTRGFSISENHLVLGASDFQQDRSRRKDADGWIFVCDLDFRIRSTIRLPRVSVHEIRQVDRPDLSLSRDHARMKRENPSVLRQVNRRLRNAAIPARETIAAETSDSME